MLLKRTTLIFLTLIFGSFLISVKQTSAFTYTCVHDNGGGIGCANDWYCDGDSTCKTSAAIFGRCTTVGTVSTTSPAACTSADSCGVCTGCATNTNGNASLCGTYPAKSCVPAYSGSNAIANCSVYVADCNVANTCQTCTDSTFTNCDSGTRCQANRTTNLDPNCSLYNQCAVGQPCSTCNANYALCGAGANNGICVSNPSADHCGTLIDGNCTTGKCATCVNSSYALCSESGSANYQKCLAKITNCPNGQVYDPCDNRCEGNITPLRLGYDSVSGATAVLQSNATNASLFVDYLKNVSIGNSSTTKPFNVSSVANFDNIAYGVTPLKTDLFALATVEYVNASLATTTQIINSSNPWTLSGNNLFASSTSWNVGIGTTNPGRKLELSVSSGDGIKLGDRGSDGNLFIGRTSSNAFGGNSGWINFGEGATDTDNFISFGTLKSGIGGGERMRIDELGNVGIGTTAPVANLHVGSGAAPSVGGAATGAKILAVGGPIFGFNSATDAMAFVFRGKSGAGNRANIRFVGDNTRNLSGIVSITNDDSTNSSSGNLAFETAYNGVMTERLRINYDGNIGIGTTTTNNKLLFVNGEAEFNSTAYGTTPVSTNNFALTTVEYVNGALSNGTGPWKRTGTSVYPSTLTDFVGIGTTAPSGDLHIKSANPQLLIERAAIGNSSRLFFMTGGSYIWNFGSKAGTNDFSITDEANSATSRLQIKAGASTGPNVYIDGGAGNVGIGVTNPQYKLDLGTTASSSIRGNAFAIGVNNGTNIGQITYLSGASGVGRVRFYSGSSINLETYGPHASVLRTIQLQQQDLAYSVPTGITNTSHVNPTLVFRTAETVGTNWAAQYMSSTTGFNLETYNHNINLSPARSPLMTLATTGSVGIGTTSEDKLLHVAGEGIFDSFSYGTTPVATNKYALTTVEFVKSSIQTATSTMTTVGRFIGVTPNTYTGDNTGTGGGTLGYDAAHEICSSTVAVASHVCSSAEMLNSVTVGVSMPTNDAWIFTGPPGYLASVSDCEGRTLGVGTAGGLMKLGAFWQAAGGSYPRGLGQVGSCDAPRRLACCK